MGGMELGHPWEVDLKYTKFPGTKWCWSQAHCLSSHFQNSEGLGVVQALRRRSDGQEPRVVIYTESTYWLMSFRNGIQRGRYDLFVNLFFSLCRLAAFIKRHFGSRTYARYGAYT